MNRNKEDTMIGERFFSLSTESRIVWLVPQAELPRYVRESVVLLPYRAGMSRRQQERGPGVVVAYSELLPTAPSDDRQGFWRRVFWLAAHDPYPGRGSPCEAVLIDRVVAGQAGQ
jgi:hypothetical protein